MPKKIKVVVLPLDERPCNYTFPELLFGEYLDLCLPNPAAMGYKKSPANIEELHNWLCEQCQDADYLIASAEMLVYGGLLPSRLHYDSEATLLQRLKILAALKQQNPKLQIYVFSLVMRNPCYSSADEEPDYYEQMGRAIFLRGVIGHKQALGLGIDEEQRELANLRCTEAAFDDYRIRRSKNFSVNLALLKQRQAETLDYLVFPQDDSAEYGLAAQDQQKLKEQIEKARLKNEVLLYPGADETCMVLLAKTCIAIARRKAIKIYLHYAQPDLPDCVPLFENKKLQKTISCHLQVLGVQQTRVLSEADAVLGVYGFGLHSYDILAISEGQKREISQYHTQTRESFVHFVAECKIPCAIADVGFSNGGDIELLRALGRQNLLFVSAGFAAWNTASNTLGTVLTQCLLYLVAPENREMHRRFLGLRYIEDIGYCAEVRQHMRDVVLPRMNDVSDESLSYFDVGSQPVAPHVHKLLRQFAAQNIEDEKYRVNVLESSLPWQRLFEVAVDVCVEEKVSCTK